MMTIIVSGSFGELQTKNESQVCSDKVTGSRDENYDKCQKKKKIDR